MSERYAVIENGKVTNMVLADADTAASNGWIQADTNTRIGDIYANGFVQVLGIEESKKVSPVEFKLLFTLQERIAIRIARSTDATIDDFFDLIDDPRLTQVDLSLKSTVDALDYLISVNLITAERKTEILAGIIK